MLIAAFAFSVAASMVLPLGLALWLSIKDKGLIKPILLGIATFTVFQFLTRLPLIQAVLPNMAWYAVMTATQPLASALFLGFTAALFEEGGRLLVMRFFMKQNRTFIGGLAFGVGHGGWEAFFLAGIGTVILFVQSPEILSPEALLAGGVERLSAMACQASFSLMVLKTAATGKPWGFVLAMAAHTLIDVFAVLSTAWGLDLWITEGILLVFALAAVAYIFIAKNAVQCVSICKRKDQP